MPLTTKFHDTEEVLVYEEIVVIGFTHADSILQSHHSILRLDKIEDKPNIFAQSAKSTEYRRQYHIISMYMRKT